MILPIEARILPIIKGCVKRLPLMKEILPKKTGGTISPRYCYSVWLRHLAYIAQYSSKIPQTVAELGPGDSPGVGLAALLSGSAKYIGLDVLNFWQASRNQKMLEDLFELFRVRADIPDNDEFPNVFPVLDDYSFPSKILPEALLKESLDIKRVQKIMRELENPENVNNVYIRYLIPWHNENNIPESTIDLLLSQAVLGQVDNLNKTYAWMKYWLRDGGIMTHTIDLTCHGYTHHWNGHWTLSEWQWNLVRGGRVFAINRQPYSVHSELLKNQGFRILTECKRSGTNNLKREDLSIEFRHITDEDLVTRGVFLLAQKG